MDPHYGTKFIYTPPYDVWKKEVTDRLGGVDKFVCKVIKYMSSVLDSSKQSAWPCDLVRAKGCVISGMPGSGKSAIARLIAEYSNLPYECISCPDLFQSDEGSSERRLFSVFHNSFIKVPRIIILDELDMIAGKTSNDMTKNTGLESRVQSLFLSLLDSVNCEKGIAPLFIIGLTNRLHALDPRITRPGRLDEIFEIPNLSADGRYQVLKRLINVFPIEPSQKDVILRDISHKTHGFIAADLRSLSTQATLNYIRESADIFHRRPNDDISTKDISLMSVRHMTRFHFDEAMKLVKPSGLSEFQTKIPDVSFAQLYGIDKIIAESTIIHPFRNPQILSRFKIKPSRGVLIYGPSGVGKSMLCYAIAKELGVNFVAVEASQMISKIVGESEANIAKLFNQARSSTPCILFIDQIDNLIPKRGTSLSSENTGDRIVTSFLTELDGIFTRSNSGSAETDIFVIATTTRPEKLDSAILRPGRLDQHLYIPVPNFKCRKSMIEGFIRHMPIDMSAEHVETIARDTEGFSGADIENMFREAALISIRENMENEKVTLNHINLAMKSIKPSLVLYTETHPI
ncbi:P-loop containing nucleoside triphosphate hydrolase protein [Paraphysoderma sedebokerense]|nr:P-loop containing nucleoside triphosphate hydrolase protein [Paraphysoderma sedebokerense]